MHVLATSFAFDGETLTRAVRTTFERRRTAYPDGELLVLTRAFLGAPARQTQWRAASIGWVRPLHPAFITPSARAILTDRATSVVRRLGNVDSEASPDSATSRRSTTRILGVASS